MSKEWNVDVRLDPSTEDENEAELIRQDLEHDPYRAIRLRHEVEPTSEQSAILDDTREAVSSLCTDLGLSPVDIPRERIHVVKDEEFEQRVARFKGVKGKVHMGHVYFPESYKDKVEFAAVATHELSHGASYYELAAKLIPAVKRMDMWSRRLGLSVATKMVTGRIYFNGLNEAVTELFAMELRKRISQEAEWDDSDRRELQDITYYQGHVLLLKKLIDIVAEKQGGGIEEVQRMLFRDHVSGSFDFLWHLGRLKKGSTRVLLDMGMYPDSPARAAKALGLSESARVIEKLASEAMSVE